MTGTRLLFQCEKCNSNDTRVCSTRVYSTPAGGRWRRHKCCACNARWTSYEGDQRKPANSSDPLTPEQVLLVLTTIDSRSDASLATEMGKSRKAISLVRNGLIYRYLHPEVPRRQKMGRIKEEQKAADKKDKSRSALGICNHWDGRCRLDIAEALHLGRRACRSCSFHSALR